MALEPDAKADQQTEGKQDFSRFVTSVALPRWLREDERDERLLREELERSRGPMTSESSLLTRCSSWQRASGPEVDSALSSMSTVLKDMDDDRNVGVINSGWQSPLCCLRNVNSPRGSATLEGL